MDRDSAKLLFKDHLQYNAALCVNPDLVLQCQSTYQPSKDYNFPKYLSFLYAGSNKIPYECNCLVLDNVKVLIFTKGTNKCSSSIPNAIVHGS